MRRGRNQLHEVRRGMGQDRVRITATGCAVLPEGERDRGLGPNGDWPTISGGSVGMGTNEETSKRFVNKINLQGKGKKSGEPTREGDYFLSLCHFWEGGQEWERRGK